MAVYTASLSFSLFSNRACNSIVPTVALTTDCANCPAANIGSLAP